MVPKGFGSASTDSIRRAAQSHYDNSPKTMKDFANEFFRSMDVNHDGGVTWEELQRFFHGRNLLIQPPYPPQDQHQLFQDLDQDCNGNLNFNEFNAFFYCLFLRANCNHCGKDLLGRKHRTCMECFTSAATQSGCITFDVCKTCYYTFRFTHHHSRLQFKKYKEAIINETAAGSGTGSTNFEIDPRQDKFHHQFVALQAAGPSQLLERQMLDLERPPQVVALLCSHADMNCRVWKDMPLCTYHINLAAYVYSVAYGLIKRVDFNINVM